MQTTSLKAGGLPSQLPFLPGNSYADPTITRYHKTQLLGVRDGTMLGKCTQPIQFLLSISYFLPSFQIARELTLLCDVEKTTSLQENVDAELLRSMREGDPLKLTGIPARKA